MAGDLLDVILIAVIAAFAVAGYRQGFIIGVLSLVGFVAGVAIGAYLAPGISHALAASTSGQALLAILVVFAMAVIGMLVASGIGVAVRSRLADGPATTADSLGGAAVNVIAVVIVAWIIGSLVVGAKAFPAFVRQVNNSAVLRTVDRVMPRSPQYLPMFPALRSLLAHGELSTTVFSAIGAEPADNLSAPDAAVLSSPALAADERSIVKVTGTARSCSQTIEGTGFVISPQHVLTNAHVVAGVDSDMAVTTSGGNQFSATVVLYDPDRDLAVLYVPQLAARQLSFAGQASFGTSGIVAGYPLSHGFTPIPARIGATIEPFVPNIYQTGSMTRQIYQIRAAIEPGNSGGPLLSTNGQVYGVVFAKSIPDQQTGYAMTAAEVAGDVRAGSHATGAVSTQACQAG